MVSPANDDLDSLLQGFKDQYQQSQQQPTAPNHQPDSHASDEIADLLSQAKSQFENQTSRKQNSNLAEDTINKNLQEFTTNSPSNSDPNYLDSWKSNFQNKQTQNQSQQDFIYKRNKQDIIHQEQQKQLNYKQKKRQAEQWLKNLDPHSDEGMWFNQLADSYDSRLEAAITYLETLEQ